MSRVKTLARLFNHQRDDAKNTIAALTYQAKAWRICALIGTADPGKGAQLAQWLLFTTMPFVDGEALERFISEHQADAEVAGLASGVFTSRADTAPVREDER